MKKKHNIAFIVTIAALLIVSFFCGFQANRTIEQKKEYNISVVLHDSSNNKWQNMKAGMRAAAREYNLRLSIVSTNADDTVEHESALVKNAAESADGIIAELSDNSYEDKFTAGVKTSVPVIFVENPLNSSTANVISIDNKTAGDSLITRALQSGSIKRIGIVNMKNNRKCNQDRMKGMQDKIDAYRLEIVWTLTRDEAASGSIQKAQALHPADIIICLDNESTEAAIDAAADGSINAAVYGFGTSLKCIYYTDMKIVTDLIVSDSYVMGYNAALTAYKRITSQSVGTADKINYRLITKANLFTSKNQQILFPIS